MPPGQTLEGFYAGESVPVNQKLSDMFLQLHISERTGRGVPKITEVYGKETYEFRENSIVVSIPFTRVRLDENTQDNTQDNTQVDTETRILSFCEVPRSKTEITAHLGYKDSRGVARNHIQPLVQKGRLAMTIPDKPNSKNQKYITIR